MVRFDHVAIGAGDLASGAAAVEAATGLCVPEGGRHREMGTHNLLTATGPDTFLEVIAVDPEAEAPDRPRWFGLDVPELRARLAARPGPHAVVLAADDLDAALDRARAEGVDHGEALAVSRGALSWRFAVRGDGAIPLGGAAPLLMEWPEGPHPAGRMADLGLRYADVEIATPEADRLRALLAALGLAPGPLRVVAAAEPALTVTLSLPGGGRAVLGPGAPAAAGAG
jgi:hypothetical protein